MSDSGAGDPGSGLYRPESEGGVDLPGDEALVPAEEAGEAGPGSREEFRGGGMGSRPGEAGDVADDKAKG